MQLKTSWEIIVGGQRGWVHQDNNVDVGFFHSFDEVKLDDYDAHKVHLFLPKSYETSGRRYPVIYMNDGHCVFWAEGLGGASWQVKHLFQSIKKCKTKSRS